MNGTFGGGTGLLTDPYLVDDWADFAEIRDGRYYALPAHMAGVNGSWKPPDPQELLPEQPIRNLYYRVSNGDAVPLNIPKESFPSLYKTGDERYPYLIYWGGFPTEEYMNATTAKTRNSEITGVMTPLNGSAVAIQDNMIAAGSLQISSAMVSGDVLIPGGAPSAELQIALLFSNYDEFDLYGAEIILSYWMLISDELWYEVPLGTFSVNISEYSSEQGMSLTALDGMNRLGKIKLSQLGIESGKMYTPYETVVMCADAADLPFCMTEQEFADFQNGNLQFILSKADNSIETARDLLMHMMQVICCFAYVDRWGVLRVIPLAVYEPARTVARSSCIQSSFSSKKYMLQELSQQVTYYEESGSSIQNIRFETLSIGVKAELPNNPLWPIVAPSLLSLKRTVQIAVNHLCTALDPIRYRPYSCSIYGDPSMNLFDFVRFTKGESEMVAPITTYDWKYRGEQEISAEGAQAMADVAKSQAEKAASADKSGMIDGNTNLWRTANLRIMQTGYIGLQGFAYETIENFTNGEIGRET